MRICIQWALATPANYADTTATDLAEGPHKADPAGTVPALDENTGWCHYICVQGVSFTANHYHVSDGPSGSLVVTVWNDDPAIFAAGYRFARVWTFQITAPDALFGGLWNTRQNQVIYAEDDARTQLLAAGADPSILKPWGDFVAPTTNVLHGPAMNGATMAGHAAVRVAEGWRSWTEGVPAAALEEGLISRTATGG